MLRAAINGFGRIGRTTLKAGWGRKGLKIVAINDLTDPSILAHLLKYDSVHGVWDHDISHGKNYIKIDNVQIPVVSHTDPAELPWKKHKVDVVIESTGRFRDIGSASKHIVAGAKSVVISAPAKEVPAFLMGVNHRAHKKSIRVVSNASCTTNSIAPVAQIMTETLGVKKAMMTTIHSATAAQNIVDGLPSDKKKPDLRRARSAMTNIVPTTTGAAKATTQVVKSLKNKFDGIAVRVPVLDVSLSDFTFLVKKKTSVKEINKIFTKASRQARWKGILGVTTDPLVSSDLIGSSYSSVVDLEMTRVVDGDLVKVLAWYDNEWGYSVRLIDMVEHVGNKL